MNPHIISTFILVCHWLIIMGLSIRIILRCPPVGVSLAWLAVIFSIPFFGAGVYLFFGEKRLGSRRAEAIASCSAIFHLWQEQIKKQVPIDNTGLSELAGPLSKHVTNVLGFPVQSGNEIQLFSAYTTFFNSLISDIQHATHRIHMDFYIWHSGGCVSDVIDALIQASKRGVDCRLLADAVGSKHFLRSKQANQLRQSGIKLVSALPTGALRTLSARSDLRNHRKIVVIDDCIAYTGSQNLVDSRFFKKDAGVGEWIDAMVRITGPTASSLAGVFQLDWSIETGSEFIPPIKPDSFPLNNHAAKIQILPSGPDIQPEAIHQLLLLAIYSARHELVMTTPYFVPDETILTALVTAALRGVKVNLIVPAHNDSMMVRYASASHYELLLNAGVTISQFKDGLLHTKSLVIDKEVSIFGSVNLDMRSLWLNFEITLVIYDADFSGQLHALQQSYMEKSGQLDPLLWKKRSIGRRFIENSFRLVSPIL